MADTDNKESERPPIDISPLALHQVEPTWRIDGYGIRGPQEERMAEKVGPTPMAFESSYPHQGGDTIQQTTGSGDCTPIDQPDEGTFVWGSIDGECQWIDTTDCSS